MSETVLSKSNFDNIILNANKPVLVDFWAPWCGPCKMFLPTLERFANEHDDVLVGKVNVDDEIDLANKYNVSSIPSLILFNNGEVAKRHVGGLSLSDLNDFVK